VDYIIDFAKELEQSGTQIKPILLIGPGIAAVIVGIIIWLAGSNFKKISFAIIGLTAGGLLGYFSTGKSINQAIGFAAAGVIIFTIIAVLLLGGSTFKRLLSALVLSVVGTAMVFAGMIMLLIYKGSQPVTYIIQKQYFFAAIFAIMAVFGTVEQLLLCKQSKKSLKTEEKKCKDR
jgi:hypothetical protein